MNPQLTAIWNAKQERVALLLASGRTIKGAAKASEVGERTAHEWLEKPEYVAYIAELRGKILSRTLGIMVKATTKAARKLATLLDDDNPAIQLRAAMALLDGTTRLRDHTEIEARMLEIERQVKGSK